MKGLAHVYKVENPDYSSSDSLILVRVIDI
jgi:hypothetical protein